MPTGAAAIGPFVPVGRFMMSLSAVGLSHFTVRPSSRMTGDARVASGQANGMMEVTCFKELAS